MAGPLDLRAIVSPGAAEPSMVSVDPAGTARADAPIVASPTVARVIVWPAIDGENSIV